MTNFKARASLGLALFMVSSLAASPGAAQPRTERRNENLQRLTQCRQETDDTRRLACYDAAVASVEQAEAKGDIVVVDREQARNVRKQAFGFPMPSLSLFDRGEKSDAVDNVSLKVESAARGPDGKWVLRLEGGQAWRQIDTAELNRPPKAGGTVTIKAAAMGSYKLSTGGAGTIRVTRDN
jgi:hypothetical protein